MHCKLTRILPLLGLSLAILAAAAGSLAGTAKAQDSLRAAAVVNDEVISVLDLLMRVRLVILGAGIEDTPEAQNRIAKQVLGRLIDERLQYQEAERLEITVGDDNVNKAVEALAGQNNMSREQLLDALQQRSIFPSTLFDQIRAELTWATVVKRSLNAKVTISEEEIDEIVARISTGQASLERRVAEITLSVETAQQEAEVGQNARRLVAQLRQGTSFSGLARQFSEAPSAALGGDLGWVKDKELAENLNLALASLKPGETSDPIRTLTGFTILMLRDQRQTQVREVDRARIEESLKKERVNQLAQRTLWQLRRNANVDIRI